MWQTQGETKLIFTGKFGWVREISWNAHHQITRLSPQIYKQVVLIRQGIYTTYDAMYRKEKLSLTHREMRHSLEAHHTTQHSGICIIKSTIAHCSPLILEEDFHTTLAWGRPIHKPQLNWKCNQPRFQDQESNLSRALFSRRKQRPWGTHLWLAQVLFVTKHSWGLQWNLLLSKQWKHRSDACRTYRLQILRSHSPALMSHSLHTATFPTTQEKRGLLSRTGAPSTSLSHWKSNA